MLETPLKPEAVEFAAVEVFPNQHRHRRYHIVSTCPEFTSVCPKTGLPDFGTITMDYVPDAHCIELKSYKYYLLSYRNVGIFYENVVNKILDDMVALCQPHYMQVTGTFSTRGGIHTPVTVEHGSPE